MRIWQRWKAWRHARQEQKRTVIRALAEHDAAMIEKYRRRGVDYS